MLFGVQDTICQGTKAVNLRVTENHITISELTAAKSNSKHGLGVKFVLRSVAISNSTERFNSTKFKEHATVWFYPTKFFASSGPMGWVLGIFVVLCDRKKVMLDVSFADSPESTAIPECAII